MLRQFEIPSIAHISEKGPKTSIIKLISGIKSHLGSELLVVTNEVRGRAQTTRGGGKNCHNNLLLTLRGHFYKFSLRYKMVIWLPPPPQLSTWFMNVGCLILHFKKLLRFTMILFRSCFYKV